MNENGKISSSTRNKIFNAAYSETVRTADVEYRDNLDFKMMLKDDLNKAISNYEHTVRREQELNQYAFITSENTRVILKSSVFLS